MHNRKTTISGKTMEAFYGTQRVMAVPMTLLEYNTHCGWVLPASIDGTDKGYLVEQEEKNSSNHKDHYHSISWSPSTVFEMTYEPMGALSFGHALVALKEGKRVSRLNWADKKVIYCPKNNKNSELKIVAKVKDEKVINWVITQEDILTNDWFVID